MLSNKCVLLVPLPPTNLNSHPPPLLQSLSLQDYVRVFEELYPHRRPLYLTPKNECSVHKLVCTTIRPSQLVYTELYDLEGCCSFVADFLAYEALEDPLVGLSAKHARATPSGQVGLEVREGRNSLKGSRVLVKGWWADFSPPSL